MRLPVRRMAFLLFFLMSVGLCNTSLAQTRIIAQADDGRSPPVEVPESFPVEINGQLNSFTGEVLIRQEIVLRSSAPIVLDNVWLQHGDGILWLDQQWVEYLAFPELVVFVVNDQLFWIRINLE